MKNEICFSWASGAMCKRGKNGQKFKWNFRLDLFSVSVSEEIEKWFQF